MSNNAYCYTFETFLLKHINKDIHWGNSPAWVSPVFSPEVFPQTENQFKKKKQTLVFFSSRSVLMSRQPPEQSAGLRLIFHVCLLNQPGLILYFMRRGCSRKWLLWIDLKQMLKSLHVSWGKIKTVILTSGFTQDKQ